MVSRNANGVQLDPQDNILCCGSQTSKSFFLKFIHFRHKLYAIKVTKFETSTTHILENSYVQKMTGVRRDPIGPRRVKNYHLISIEGYFDPLSQL